jgi:hypothetical protein
MVLQLDPLDHHFDPEGQAPTLWVRTSWSTGSEGPQLRANPSLWYKHWHPAHTNNLAIPMVAQGCNPRLRR